MDRHTRAERIAAIAVIAEESPHLAPVECVLLYEEVMELATRLHRLYEDACSRDLGTTGNAKRRLSIDSLEAALRSAFAGAKLDLYLNDDPRGNPVGILTPKTGKYNTLGGAECGWRL